MLFRNKQTHQNPLFEAVGCVCNYQKKILLLKRSQDKSYPGYWGVPGGKVKENENYQTAVIRELFEETGILLSSDNIVYIRKYHVVTDEFNFLYSLFTSDFSNKPKVKLNALEHVSSYWFKYEEMQQIQLIPDLFECLRDAAIFNSSKPKQLKLFGDNELDIKYNIQNLEHEIEHDFKDKIEFRENIGTKNYSVSFGPPAAGKSTSLRYISKNNLKYTLIEDATILRKRASRLHYYLRRIWEDNDHSFFFYFQMEVLPFRYWYTVGAPTNSLVDETIFSTLAYSRALHCLKWLTDFQYETFFMHYSTYLKFMPLPKNILYFKCDKNTLTQRMNKRGRKIEKYYTQEYIDALYFSFDQLAKDLSLSINVIEIETGFHNTADVSRFICEKI